MRPPATNTHYLFLSTQEKQSCADMSDLRADFPDNSFVYRLGFWPLGRRLSLLLLPDRLCELAFVCL